jgi:two-component system sensor histidine kinase/response regulator
MMNSLRFLLVHRDPEQSEVIASRLERANHTVLPTPGLDEAADALTVEQFDAVLMESAFQQCALQAFSAQLRQMERSGRNGARIPVIALSDLPADSFQSAVDAVVPEPVDPVALTAAVARLAQAVLRPPGPSGAEPGARPDASANGAALQILDPEKFKEQVGHDNELMVEIIDLFLDECKRQEIEMRDALEAGDFELLCRVAHTIKGSLGSLHGMRARAHAQVLELAARDRDEVACWDSLAALEIGLAELEPELLALRATR